MEIRHSKKQKGKLLEAAKPGTPIPGNAWTPLFVMAVAVAAVIIGVVVWLTPKPPDDPAVLEALKAEMNLDRVPLDKSEAPPAATLVLPEQPIEIEDRELFGLLEQMAERVVDRLPNDPAALHIAALIHSELKQTTDAEALWKRCLSNGSTQPGPYLAYADLLIRLGRADEAETLLEKHWTLLSAWPEAANVRAQVLDQLGEPERAVTLLEESLRGNPRYADNWLELGQLQNQLRKHADAESSLRTAVGLGMTANETLLFALSTAVARQNRPEEAKQLMEVFQQLKDNVTADPSGDRFQEAYSTALQKIGVRAQMNASAMYNELGQLEWAEETVMQLLEMDPDHVTGLMTLSSILRKTGRLADALIVHEKILAREPDNPLNVINLASIQLELGQAEQAETLLREQAAREPSGSGFLHAELARMYMNLNRYEEARKYARLAVERQPTIPFYSLLASVCKQLNDQGGLFEAVSAIQRLERGQAIPGAVTSPSPTATEKPINAAVETPGN